MGMKKSNIILSGVGGQGILTIAGIIGMATLKEKLYFKKSGLLPRVFGCK